MAFPHVFANLAAGNVPASYLDDNFNALGSYATVPCTAAGANAITLTLAANTPAISAYNQLQAFRFVAANNSTGTVTVGLASPGLLPAYKPSTGGPTACGSGDIVIGEAYDAVYDVALNAGGGGFHVYNVIPATASGTLVQVVNTSTGASSTGTGTFTVNNSIPTNTNGDQVMSLAITPTNASHHLIIVAVVNAANSNSGQIISALYQDSTANALETAISGPYVAAALNLATTWTLVHYMAAGTTSSTTFKIRIGGSAAGTTTFNGQSGSQIFGGVLKSSITIYEVV